MIAAYLKNGAGEVRKQPDKQNSYSLVIREGARRGFGELVPEQSFDVWAIHQITPEPPLARRDLTEYKARLNIRRTWHNASHG